MGINRYTNADYRRAIDSSTRKTVEESKRAGRPISHDAARREAVKRAERVQRKHEKK